MYHNYKIIVYVSVLLSIILLIGCAKKFSISGTGKKVIADDGYPLMTYKLEMEPDIFKGQPPKVMLFYIQGSEYKTVLSKVGFLAGSVAMGTSVFMLERRGIDENQNPVMDTCYKYSSKEVRIRDHLKVIDEYLKNATSNIPVILMGESEGGDIASVIATREPRISHLILLGSGGGWSQAQEMEFFLLEKGGFFNISSLDELNSVFEDIKAHPDSLKMWYGHPYRRWSSYLWEKSIDYLITLDIPIFFAHGDQDASVPVESARAVKEKYDESGKTNLTYKEYKNVNHSFVNLQDGFLMIPLIEVDILRWLQGLKIITENERKTSENRVRKAHPEIFYRN